MSEGTKNRRILLRPDVAAKVSQLVTDLRGKHCTVDSSKLANAVLDIFFERYVTKEEKVIEQLFFNKKAFIREALSGADSEEELEAVLKDALKKVGARKKTRKENEDSSWC